MSASHPPVERLTRILAQPHGDAERAHVEGCERCQASLTALQEFLSLDVANSPELAQDDARLAAMVQGIVGTDAKAAGPARVLPMSPPRARRTNLPGILAIAACLALVSTLVLMRRADTPAQFRGEAGAAQVQGAQATDAGGGVILSWDAYPGAGFYRVQVFDAQVHEVARYGPVAGSRISIEADSLAALAQRVPAGEMITWQVVALSGRDPIAHSPWTRFPLAGR
jgi:hypothetical protein